MFSYFYAMVVSELKLLDFFTQTLRLPEEQARGYIREIVAAEEKLHGELTQTIDKKFEERKNALATKDDIHLLDQKISALEVKMEQNTNKLLIWLVSVIFASSGLIVALIKLL